MINFLIKLHITSFASANYTIQLHRFFDFFP